jgi:16S rRNA (adenine1518-N6/adenine1519-N6)-dimethyltransferase
VDAGARVTALELDRHVLPVLTEVVGGAVEIVQGDALTVDLDELMPASEAPWHVVSNLPYNVATPIVARVLDECPQVADLLVMVQREVGERLAARARTKQYGGISVKVAYYGSASVVGLVSPGVFVPPPKVGSALVRIVRHARPPVDVPEPSALFALVKAGFGQRRKMLRRALQPALGDRTAAVLETAGVEATRRAEELDLDAWAAIARAAA